MRAVVRGRTGYVRVWPVRRGQWRTGAGRRGDLPRAEGPTDQRGHGCQCRTPVAGKSAQLGRPRSSKRDVPGPGDTAMKLHTHKQVPSLQDRLVWQSASLLLAYPDQGRLDIADELL